MDPSILIPLEMHRRHLGALPEDRRGAYEAAVAEVAQPEGAVLRFTDSAAFRTLQARFFPFTPEPTPPEVTIIMPAAEGSSVPPSQWPWLARWLAKLAKEGEAGVGDTTARLLGLLGASTLAEAYTKITGRDCGCGDRQAKLNALYPYT